MKMGVAVTVLLLGVLALRGFGLPQEQVGTAMQWRVDADLAFDAKDYEHAARFYQYAFSLLDPSAQSAQDRALMAFRCGRSRAHLALEGTGTLPADIQAAEAQAWLRQALVLEPSLRQVQFELARLLEAAGQSWMDTQGAARAYRAYLDATQAADAVPESERERVDLARQRLGALEQR